MKISDIKLDFWEFFVFFLTGFVFYTVPIALESVLGPLSLNIPTIKTQGDVTLLSSFGVFLGIFILGVVIDPLANTYQKQLKKLSSKKREKRTASIENKIKEMNPDINFEGISLYKFCKASIEQIDINSSVSTFLSRFGLYRNLSFIFLLHAIIIFFDGNISLGTKVATSAFLLFLARVLIKRSSLYHIHLESEVYYQYLAHKYEGKKC